MIVMKKTLLIVQVKAFHDNTQALAFLREIDMLLLSQAVDCIEWKNNLSSHLCAPVKGEQQHFKRSAWLTPTYRTLQKELWWRWVSLLQSSASTEESWLRICLLSVKSYFVTKGFTCSCSLTGGVWRKEGSSIRIYTHLWNQWCHQFVFGQCHFVVSSEHSRNGF